MFMTPFVIRIKAYIIYLDFIIQLSYLSIAVKPVVKDF